MCCLPWLFQYYSINNNFWNDQHWHVRYHRTVLVAFYLKAAFDNVDHQQQLDCVFNTNMPATIRRWLYSFMQNRRAKVHFWQQDSKSRKMKTGVVQGDLKAAFDNVDHQQQLDCVFNTNMPATIRRWLYSFMQNRRAKVHFRQQDSKSRKMKTGVVQGGVLSPALFSYYQADLPTPPPNIKLTKYADGIIIYTSGPVVSDLINGLNIYLLHVLNYINNNKLTVSTAKCTVTLFTPDTHKHHIYPQVKLTEQLLPLEKKLKMLGVMLDTQLSFTQHCNNIAVEV